MVEVTELTSRAAAWLTPLLAEADEKAQPLLWRLDPGQRANVLMALLGLTLLGAALVAIVILGARHLRRIARKRSGPTRPPEDQWYRKPLVPLEPRENQNPDSPQ